MRVLQNFKFFENTVSPAESNVLTNSSNGETMVLQVSGNSASMVLKVLTRADTENADFEETPVIGKAPVVDLFDEITTNGIYSIGVAGVKEIKLQLVSSSGDVNVFATVVE